MRRPIRKRAAGEGAPPIQRRDRVPTRTRVVTAMGGETVGVGESMVSEGRPQRPMPAHGGVCAGQRYLVMNAVDWVIRWSTALVMLSVAALVQVSTTFTWTWTWTWTLLTYYRRS
jgi:hypothetical protein